VIPGAWGLPREQRQKREVTQKESLSPEQPSRFNKFAPSPLPVVVATAFEVHEVAAPLDVPEQSVDKTPVEAHAAPKAFGVTKGPDLKTDIASLLASKTGLREAIILREIFGPPRGLHEPDAIL